MTRAVSDVSHWQRHLQPGLVVITINRAGPVPGKHELMGGLGIKEEDWRQPSASCHEECTRILTVYVY